MNAVSNQIENPKLLLQRRRVYSALKPILDSKTLFQSMWLWEEEFSTRQPLQMRNFIAVLVERGLLVTSAHKAYKQLVYFFMQDENSLEKDPYEEMLLFRNKLKVNSKPITPAKQSKLQSSGGIVFEKVLGEFLTSVGTLNGKSIDSIAQHLSKPTSDLKLSKAQKHDLVVWVNNQSNNLDMAYNVVQMSAIINATYVVACKHVGPVKADKCLSRAIKTSEDLPEALKFPPRQLL